MPTKADKDRLAIGGNNPPTEEQLAREQAAPLFDRLKAWKRKAEKANLAPQTREDIAILKQLLVDGKDLINDAASKHTVVKKPYLDLGRMVDGIFNGEIRDVAKPLTEKIDRAASARELQLIREEQAATALAAEKTKADAEKLTAKAEKQEEKGNVRVADVTMAQAAATHDLAERLEVQSRQDVSVASKTTYGSVKSKLKVSYVCTSVVRNDLDLKALLPFIKAEILMDAVTAYLKQTGETKFAGASVEERASSGVRK